MSFFAETEDGKGYYIDQTFKFGYTCGYGFSFDVMKMSGSCVFDYPALVNFIEGLK